MREPSVLVIVPFLKGEPALERCKESLLKVDYPKDRLEVKFVEDVRRLGPATARNAGAKGFHGDILIFTDADCIIPPNWVRGLLKNFGGGIVMVGGGIKPYSTERLSERFEQHRRERLYGTIKRFAEVLPGCNMAIRREVFDKIGGFDESFRRASGEDWDLCQRASKFGKIVYDPSASVIHIHSKSIRGILNRAFVHGREGMRLRPVKPLNIRVETGFWERVLGIIYRDFSLAGWAIGKLMRSRQKESGNEATGNKRDKLL